MKYSQLTGIIICILMVILCYLPWTYIESKNILVTGMDGGATRFGKPGLMIVMMSCLAIIGFLLPFITVKRMNVFVAAIIMGWTIRNFIILSACFMGECPKVYFPLYVFPILALCCLLCTVLYKKKFPKKV